MGVAPLVAMRLMPFARPNSAVNIGSLASAGALRLGVLNAGGMREYCQSLGLASVQPIVSDTRAVRMLLADHFDAVLTADHAVKAAIRELAWRPGAGGFAKQIADGTRRRVLERYGIT